VLGCGGIQDSPEIRDYYKRHKEVTGVDADYWASPIYHSLLQMLTQAFEGVGSFDREAITAHLKKNTYKTIIGEIDVRNQRLNRYWTVGQWQEGTFHAVAGVGFNDYKPVKLKTGWA
jgi:branched-chain amino acid transport system substrate-binding protein